MGLARSRVANDIVPDRLALTREAIAVIWDPIVVRRELTKLRARSLSRCILELQVIPPHPSKPLPLKAGRRYSGNGRDTVIFSRP